MRGRDDHQARKAGVLRIAGFVVLIAAGSQVVPAQDFPSKPVRLIVGAAAGSSGDVLARLIGDELAKTWKQSVVIDNRPGAGGIIANQALLGAPTDGHTLMLSAGSYLTVTPFTQKSLHFSNVIFTGWLIIYGTISHYIYT